MKKNKLQKPDKKYAVSLAIAALAAIGLFGASMVSAASTAFSDDTLVRGEDGRVFVIKQGQKVKINSLDDLRRDFRGRQIINVDDDTLAGIKLRTDNSGPGSVNSNNSGPGNARDRSLIRGNDGKIFEIVNGERRRIKNLEELRINFRNRQVINVDNAVLRRFPVVIEDNPDRLFDNNRLVRNRNGQIFVIEDNALRRIADINELRREHLGQRIHNVDDDVLRNLEQRAHNNGLDDFVNGVKLRGDGTVDDNSDGSDDSVGGVKLRGDGTVDDNLPRHSGLDDGGSGRGGSSGSSGSSGGGSSDD